MYQGKRRRMVVEADVDDTVQVTLGEEAIAEILAEYGEKKDPAMAAQWLDDLNAKGLLEALTPFSRSELLEGTRSLASVLR